MKLLGLDIGTNSVGSAWIDTDKKTIKLGVSVFPAGVEESGDKRGDPKNQARRCQRQQKRSIARRAILKRQLRQYLAEKNWMPTEKERLQRWENLNPWLLRRDAVREELTADDDFQAEEKFGRILLHLAQRRGAWWFDEEREKEEDRRKEEAQEEKPGTVEYTKAVMEEKGARTFGELIAIEYESRTTSTKNHKVRHNRVRNRADLFGDKVSEYVADRHMIMAEFETLWRTQRSFGGMLAEQLTDDCRKELYHPQKTNIWRCQGALFSQRKAYWNLGTLGRCDLEPTDMKCPKADMYAQEFLVLTSINNIRITRRTEASRKLRPEERKKVLSAVRKQKTASEATIRKALGKDKGANKTHCTLNTDGDKFTVNGDWFYSQIACGVFGEDAWKAFGIKKREAINRAILKFDPAEDSDVEKLAFGCGKWWGLDDKKGEKLLAVWKKRPKIDSRVNLSRKAIKNLLPYLRDGWSVTEARDMYAKDTSHGADDLTWRRYSTREVVVNKRIRQFQEKHPDLLPPVSEGISNPVVRKSIHEVRRHLMEYIRKYDKPDRVGIELARKARQSERVIARRLQKNKAIDALRKEIIETHGPRSEKAIKRVRLCRQQREMCAYSGATITDKAAVEGTGLEIDHIVPRSRGGGNGMSNLVLCYASANQGKGKRTPIDWLSTEDFAQLELRFKHLHLHKGTKGKRFITKDNVDMVDNTKWENLHRSTPKEGFTEEQLCSSAYAATQTSDWINKVLYGTEDRRKRYVFASGGQYTGILRRDWGLFFDEDGERSERGRKNRGDHRHHAVDAAIIAVTAQCLAKIKQSFIDYENQKENKKVKPEWKTVDQPWEGFSEQVAEEYKKLKVSHRPQRRKLVLALHNDSLYGPAYNENGIRQKGYVVRSIAVMSKTSTGGLKPKHLGIPDGWEDLRRKLENAPNKSQRKKVRKQMLSLPDVKPATSGIVKDRWLREEIRNCLRCNGLNPDRFTRVELKKLVEDGKLTLGGGNPLRKVRILWSLTTLPPIKRKKYDFYKNRCEYDENPKSKRYYKPDGNHHIEIRQAKNGNWKGEPITLFEAARRNVERLNALKESGVPSVNKFRELKRDNPRQYQEERKRCKPIIAKINTEKDIVDRSNRDGNRFIMSLCIGDTVHMTHPSRKGVVGYFVVFKMSGNRVSFTPHYSTGKAQPKDEAKRRKGEAYREEIEISVGDLRKLIVFNENGVPGKVKISQLGEVRVLVRD